MQSKTKFSVSSLVIVTGLAMCIAAGTQLAAHAFHNRQAMQALLPTLRPYQIAIEQCFHRTRSLHLCNQESQQIPGPISISMHHPSVQSLTVTHGKISMTPRQHHGLKAADTLMLIPHVVGTKIAWQKAGGSVESGYVE
jgi:hypothetical protein